MHYRVDEQNYIKVLTQFIDIKNPPEYILCYEIRNRHTLMSILNIFSNTKFYIVDEPYFLRPLLKWPGKNYSERILGYEMLQTKKDTTIEELQGSLKAILKKAGEKELTVIMNPPYGKSNKIVKPIIKQMLDCDFIKETICLAPTNAFKPYISHIQNFEKVENLFDSAVIENLASAKLLPKEVNKFSFEELMLEKDELELFEAIQKYNENHENHWKVAAHGASDLRKKWIQISPEFENKSLKDCAKENRLFYTTCWTPFDGVHLSTDCWDYKLNILNMELPEEKLKVSPVRMFLFKNNQCKINFTDWWYSCKKNCKESKKRRIGLTNKILDIMLKIVSGSASEPSYIKHFPNLDWSRPWTDEEIIQELKDKAGLPQDWELKE